ncbi:ATP-grasp domain-containing protein [Pseudoduganella namucuonensis]|uniref:Biotin carboxylase n=1 Tax=Pseudoduganella namucuonensis TaxID=1035707 RepID=A0A1I7JE04_9BURK|nr:ATP-grasp domain-containing protein [Pseudoduganella namucuonensis]SFU83409.1 Biotin carboxylase [Pseudoduganella namucuonensis]
MQELIILAHVPTDTVNLGFLPAAQALGLSVVLLTDHADAHRAHYSQPGLAAYPAEIVACDVFNPLAVIGALTCRAQTPAAVFSNSDHLQASTALVASYFDLPHKDWRVTYRAKNKAEMRSHLKLQGLDPLWYGLACGPADLARLAEEAPLPCIVKPREGVASQQVTLAANRDELAAQCAAVWESQPGLPLLLEEYIDGPLYTLETLGDGERVCVLGGFQVTLSPPPFFVELEARWGTGLDERQQARVLDLVRRFGVGFGACHTEFVMSESGPRLIEINYRNIGDYREFLLQETLAIPLFEIVLRLYLGEPLPDLRLAPNAAQIRYFTARSEGRLSTPPAAFADQGDGMQLHYQPLRAAGDSISLSNSNKDYLGVLRGIGPDARRLGLAMDRVSNTLNWEIAA